MDERRSILTNIMASKEKQIINSVLTTNKEFDYSTGNVVLKFTLNIDIKSQLTDYLQLLKAAQLDVQKEIDNHK
jgi:hypothetical protein